jgi:O-methyltransferase
MEAVARAINEAAPYTMVPAANVELTIESVFEAIDSGRIGDLVECGVWRGGCSFAMLLAQRYRYGRIIKPVWMFDSFEGLPPVDERDGPAAAQYQQDVDAPNYFDNCRAELDGVVATIEQFGFTPDEAIVIPGWFSETVPDALPEMTERGVSVLRIDCDWYEPVAFVLAQLSPLVADEGRILLDDYYAWDGCALATHVFLAQNNHSWRIRSMPETSGAWMIKRPFRRDAL